MARLKELWGPKSILMFTAILEGLVLYFYQTRGGRRKKKTA